MDAPPKPTSTESSLDARRLMVALSREGQPYAVIAARLGVSVWTVGRWVRAERRAGAAGLAYRDRRPRTPHPRTSPPAVQARIAAVRAAHPGWGARLIRRQLAAEGVTPLASERTVHAWLRRQGAGPVRPPRGKPLGWATAAPVSATPLWEVDFKQKGGRGG